MTMTEAVATPAMTQPQIDHALLREAQRHLGGGTPNEACNQALELLVERQRTRRREALRDLRKMSAEGVFDYSALDEVDE
jgi:Arc/MetJ family transcription regulator